MRIEGFSSSYLPERVARGQTAVAPFRQVQQQAQQRQQPLETGADAPTNAQQNTAGLAPAPIAVTAQTAPVNALASALTVTRSSEQWYQAPLSSQVSQALASYTQTASFVTEGDAYEVMGLDLYA